MNTIHDRGSPDLNQGNESKDQQSLTFGRTDVSENFCENDREMLSNIFLYTAGGRGIEIPAF